MNKQRTITLICFALFGILLWVSAAEAQIQRGWSPPYQLSGAGSKASEASLVADPYGYLHAFWSEELSDGEHAVLQYARFDGWTWSTPVDIHIAAINSPMKGISPFVDEQGRLHLVWTQGQAGAIRYTYAPVHDALSAQKWQKPLQIKVSADRAKVLVDPTGIIHVLYGSLSGEEPGVYAVRSEDGGLTWSIPVWIDSDIPPNKGPSSLQFALDDSGGLHAVWFYISLIEVSGDWVRYAHSLDGGKSWSPPFTIDKVGEEEGSVQLDAASPIMAVVGQTVHVIWAGGEQHYRNHRYSTDAGRTWSRSFRIFGNLSGQAFEGMTVDGAGRVHFFGQIRYPQGIYHAYWDENRWSEPSLIYLISRSPTDPIGNRIHAHHTHPAIRAGNQLVLTFADSPPEPARRLFVTTYSLQDIQQPLIVPTPTPTPVATSVPEPDTDPMVDASTPLPVGWETVSPPADLHSPGEALWFGFMVTLFVIGSAVVFQWFKNGR